MKFLLSKIEIKKIEELATDSLESVAIKSFWLDGDIMISKMAIELEKEFNIIIQDDMLKKMITFGDFYDIVAICKSKNMGFILKNIYFLRRRRFLRLILYKRVDYVLVNY